MENSDIKKTIGIVSSVTGVQTQSSVFFLKKIIPALSMCHEVDLFIPERGIKEYSMWKELDCSVRHLHTLPYMLSGKHYHNIIYSLDNHVSAYLCSWYLKLYPGMLVLQDKNFFRLECEALGHGSDAFELNELVQSEYGDTAIRIGDQHIRQRSLDIYGELYPFLGDIMQKASGVVVFGGSDDIKETAGMTCNLLKRTSFLEPENALFHSKSERMKKICVLIESPFSRAALDILRVFPVKKSIGNFPMLVLLETDTDTSQMTCSLVRENEHLDMNQTGGVIVAGNRPYHGMRGMVCEALEAGLPVSCEYSGEYRDLNYQRVLFHGKEESLICRLHSVQKYEAQSIDMDSEKEKSVEVLIRYIDETSEACNEKLHIVLEKQKEILLESLEESRKRLDQCISFFPELKEEISHLQQQYAKNAEIFFWIIPVS